MSRQPLLAIAENELCYQFPDPVLALDDPDGLLAAGGDLSIETLLDAYRRGIFPWYSDGQPVLWWSPSQRSVVSPGAVHVSRSLRKLVRQQRFDLSYDHAFEAVIDACAAPRRDLAGTWITPDMRDAYVELHHAGHAHSIECWLDTKLVGGLYGVAIGRVFFGESMFSRVSNGSKVALVELSACLQQWHYGLIDCQIHNPHLASMGATTIGREAFLKLIGRLCPQQPSDDAWSATRRSPA